MVRTKTPYQTINAHKHTHTNKLYHIETHTHMKTLNFENELIGNAKRQNCKTTIIWIAFDLINLFLFLVIFESLDFTIIICILVTHCVYDSNAIRI